MKLREVQQSVNIRIDGVEVQGFLTVHSDSKGIIIFSHGSGSGRLSPRNNYVAQKLNRKGFATFLVDLLTESEEWAVENRFNINLLTRRLIAITNWIKQNPQTRKLPIAYFGASTGAASALKASVFFGNEIRAVVSRGGRPDLVFRNLENVQSPTLLIVGKKDHDVLRLNEEAFAQLKCKKDMEIIPGASHLFEEPGKMDKVANLAATWFLEHPPSKEASYVQKQNRRRKSVGSRIT
jgi:dienelactone hydrolase